MSRKFFHGANAALFTDYYQLTMAQAYLESGHDDVARFDLFVRKLPPDRGYILACGQHQALGFLESLHFSNADIHYLRSLGRLSDTLLNWLSDFRFTGDVQAVPEGTVVFGEEPILSVRAPIAQAQIVETWLLNQVHLQTLLATKASRVVSAARGRPVLDFGLRRIHGADAGMKAARAYHAAGVAATSNVLAGKILGVPVAGTMAHSLIQSYDDEVQAFRDFVASFPETILLVDTYDTLRGVRRVIELSRELGDDFRVSGIRLDSGDLDALSRRSRELLDEAGLDDVKIYVSGGLDEYAIERLMEDGAPIDGFGVGTAMGVSSDEPSMDVAYKLSEYGGEPRMKLSAGKRSLPGEKQVYRQTRDGRFTGDVIGLPGEKDLGDPLLKPVMRGGRLLDEPELESTRRRAAKQLQSLPEPVRALDPAESYPVRLSEGLEERMTRLRARLGSGD